MTKLMSGGAELRTARRTVEGCIVHVAGVLIFAPGIILVVTTHQEIAVIVGSLLIVGAALMFMWIYFTHDHRTSPD
jgi:hypothetical protein